MSSPILLWQPSGGTPVTVEPEIPAGRVAGEHGLTLLTEDQEYVDVVFVTTQPRSDWTFTELQVVNTTDADPLNIWAGIVIEKTRAGFRLQLNGLPDSGNYYLDWTIGGATVVEGGAASVYTLSGPESGAIDAATAFVVALPDGTSVDGIVTVIMDDAGDGGAFTPTTVELTTDVPSANFTYTPASYGDKVISVTNDGFLTDPVDLAFTSVVSTYLLSGPSTGLEDAASTDFTVELPSGGVTLSTITVTPSDGGTGTFDPTTVTLTTASPSATFTYTPTNAGVTTVDVTNNRGLTDPDGIEYTATAPGLADGDLVSSWTDSSGNGHHGTNSGAARPTFKTNIINSKPVVRFASASSTILNITSPITGASPWTIFVVMKPAGGSGAVLLGSLIGAAASPYAAFENSDGNLYVKNRSWGAPVVGMAFYAAFHIFEVISNGTGVPLVVADGSLQTTGAASAGTGSGDWDNIATATSNGDIAEIIIYNVDLATPDSVSITKYLSDKYAISVSSGGTAAQPDIVSGLVGWWKADSL